MYKKGLKRFIDFMLALGGMFVFAIPMLMIAFIVKLDSPGPALFRQRRVGIGKSHFNMLKFRSMRTDAPHDTPTHQLQGSAGYITKVGAFLRKTSLDELPQLLNILKGDMSIVGPRPALWNQYDLIEERDRYGANDVRPGLTGLAQISGRDELEIPVKAALDGKYVSSMSFITDLKCFFLTIVLVLKRDGVVEGGTGELRKRALHKVKMMAVSK